MICACCICVVIVLIFIFIVNKIFNVVLKPYPLYTEKDEYKQSINILTRQCARWAIAATQDTSPMIKLLHANYAAGYLWAISDIASDKDFEDASGIDYLRFKTQIMKIQDSATRRVSELCTNFAPEVNGLTAIASRQF
jgi:hypothetical protein